MDLNKLNKNALAAAMRGGTESWGKAGSSIEHVRYMEPIETRKKCLCGCGQLKTHLGLANGVGLTSGCELIVRRWVKTGRR